MKHPFETLKPEYSQLLSIMVVRPECRRRVDEVATKILAVRARFEDVKKVTGVPVVFSGPSFYRESDLDFDDSPAQGDPWRKVSRNVPRGRGPFRSWLAAAVDAYHLNGLDRVGDGKWTWEIICFYSELFNGFGYRDEHKMHSPYLWGGTNIQSVGKYTSDRHFDPAEMDSQLGVIPIAKRLAEIAPDLALPVTIPAPVHSGISVTETGFDTQWVQESLNELGHEPLLDVDGSYGRETRFAVIAFESAYGLKADGYAGPQVVHALQQALFELRGQPKQIEAQPSTVPLLAGKADAPYASG
jgi:lysozyme family protein